MRTITKKQTQTLIDWGNAGWGSAFAANAAFKVAQELARDQAHELAELVARVNYIYNTPYDTCREDWNEHWRAKHRSIFKYAQRILELMPFDWKPTREEGEEITWRVAWIGSHRGACKGFVEAMNETWTMLR
jgi:hypothetical protein